MSTQDFTLEALPREDTGKGASRRLRRREDQVPGIIYGGDAAPLNISILHKDLMHASENDAFFSSIISLNVAGKKENVVVKDLQRHPARPIILHADFQRVKADQPITVKVPIHILNEAKAHGVRLGGGVVNRLITELEVICLPRDLPESIEVDVVDMKVGESIHIADLKLPKGVTSVSLSHGDSGNLGVVTISVPKGGAAAAEEEGGEEAK